MVYVITIIRCVSNIISKTQVRKLPKHLDPVGSGSATLPPTPPCNEADSTGLDPYNRSERLNPNPSPNKKIFQECVTLDPYNMSQKILSQ